MKRIWILFISLFLIPTLVNAETLTYEVCESGCEYTNLSDVGTAIGNISDLSDKDIIININSDLSNGYIRIGSESDQKTANSVLINGNNYAINFSSIYFYANSVTLKNIKKMERELYFYVYNAQKIKLENSDISQLLILYLDNSTGSISQEEKDLSKILEIDEISNNNLLLALVGNIKIENMDLKNYIIALLGGTLNISNSEIGKTLSVPQSGFTTINIYNSKFNSLKYKNFSSFNEYSEAFNDEDSFSSLEYDIYDVMAPSYSKTTVYFDKEFEINSGEEIDLKSVLDYFPEDEEITYLIDDDDVASIDNLKLKGLSSGKTYIEITTGSGLLVYRVMLKVGEDNLAEQIDRMTVRVPITGSKIKAWVLVISLILLTLIGICTYILINRRKQGK